ncbi:hypothetical protein HTT03_09470 [Sulfitobacter sp. S0837]|uniref:hypothetical protein n=1 Tax=Sulfitobacter maritimus TaxID=2741719 RepID=UPI001581BEB2|nr:hypothetical protein [Sulfitobacter maritimus]NUH65514.1 hypothetical protein [Sulfitobacter maritimus]
MWIISILVFLPAAYHGVLVLAGLAVAAFFYELGKLSGTIDLSLRVEQEADGAVGTPSVITKDGEKPQSP